MKTSLLLNLSLSGLHFADDFFQFIVVREMVCILIKISLKFLPKRPIQNNTVLLKMRAQGRLGDKPLSAPILTQYIDAYMRY